MFGIRPGTMHAPGTNARHEAFGGPLEARADRDMLFSRRKIQGDIMSQQEILDVLRTHGPMGLHEIHTTIGRAQSQTSKALTKLVQLGEIVKGPDRIYRVMK